MNRLWLLLLAMAFRCGEQPPQERDPSQPWVIEFEDGLGRAIRLRRVPQRLVSLAPSTTEILFKIGAGHLLVGRDEQSDFPDEVRNVPSIGATFPNVNLELIVRVEPDLVLASGVNSPEDIQSIEALGIPVYAANPTQSMSDLYHDIACCGRLVNDEAAAQQLEQEIRNEVARIEQIVQRAEHVPTVFYEVDATNPAQPWTPGANSFLNELIELAGGNNLAAAGGQFYYQISVEEVFLKDPEVILLGSSSFGTLPEHVAERPGWGWNSSCQERQGPPNECYTAEPSRAARGPGVAADCPMPTSAAVLKQPIADGLARAFS